MPRAQANGIELEYDTFGDPANPALVLVMGLRTQMIAWEEELCGLLADQGFHVIRFDNRDCGLSTQFDHLPAPDFAAIFAGDRTTVPYTLADMALDLVGLLDALGVDKAHLVGASMGGMIAQQCAIDHSERVLSLCSIMSTTGNPAVGQPSPEALALLDQRPATTREEAVEASVAAWRVFGSPGVDEEQLRARSALAYDRAYNPAGGMRQYAAIIASPDRTPGLQGVRLPALVVHGTADTLVNPSGGQATAAAIPDAELLLVDGMGHDLPPTVWPTLVRAIRRNADRAAA
ncbi:pimeloyl-ACP methyl ester carboxylesterase [Saccharothrix coeruleofusca]|uniref:alpha/beta fold hydrolase n=1 Tax=Saccharothrix coeruleofusca TaxID=33919 RepID=UPI001AE9D434|nr:alpha/beta hydrolase [Saccharothrix coeruleofusca]MBP2336258.1 pimeloyl-ACP methyl ester carboxylesterase [Saccharothrix coeruleofusca]